MSFSELAHKFWSAKISYLKNNITNLIRSKFGITRKILYIITIRPAYNVFKKLVGT